MIRRPGGTSPRRLLGRSSGLLLVGLFLAGCGADASHGAHPAGEDEGVPASPLGTLSASTEGGTHVMVTFAPDPPLIGPVDVFIELHPAPTNPDQVSVDLVSPDMPAHGVARTQASAGDRPGHFHARVMFPMEGHWELYVNLDIGHEAASFAVHVPAEAEGRPPAQHQHHGTSGPDGEHQHHVP